ncbi:chorismate mutase [uncultured Roseobacter sp.]|uniref:chorismate mutase n=1 Tax=uncultured Roseobacter sp. TaxID=114847 RepID=UPI002604A320|nr:chorismate mutase [uncultured Roseobacter sp.]
MRLPADCTDMTELRAGIDALDREIIALLARRVGYIDRAAEIKAQAGLPANIPARVEEVVARVRAAAGEAGFDPALAETIWREMIGWSIAREEEKLGAQAPTE